MATEYDKWIPVANKIIKGLSAKPGIHIVNKEMATNWLAQALNGAEKKEELPIQAKK